MSDLKAQQQDELERLEGQVREALALKDAFIEGLQHKLTVKTKELQHMHQLLSDQTHTLD